MNKRRYIEIGEIIYLHLFICIFTVYFLYQANIYNTDMRNFADHYEKAVEQL